MSSPSLIFLRHFFPRDLSIQTVTNCFHESIRFTVPTLIALLGLSFQLSDHTITVCFAGCALLVYFLAISGHLDFSFGGYSASVISSNCMIWSGKLLVGLLASVLFPEFVRFLLFFPFWVFIVTDKRLLPFIYDRFLHLVFKKIAPNSFSRGPTLLPR
ncbi:hypothetical protein ACP275_05G086600 [Erythranthe tilingii]